MDELIPPVAETFVAALPTYGDLLELGPQPEKLMHWLNSNILPFVTKGQHCPVMCTSSFCIAFHVAASQVEANTVLTGSDSRPFVPLGAALAEYLHEAAVTLLSGEGLPKGPLPGVLGNITDAARTAGASRLAELEAAVENRRVSLEYSAVGVAAAASLESLLSHPESFCHWFQGVVEAAGGGPAENGCAVSVCAAPLCEKTSSSEGREFPRCSKCSVMGLHIAYCGTECQKADWKRHKRICGKEHAEVLDGLREAAGVMPS